MPDMSSFLLIVSPKTMIPNRYREEEALNSIKSLQPTVIAAAELYVMCLIV